MRPANALWLIVFGLLACGGGTRGDVCTDDDPGTLRCAIASAADCGAVRNYPYARNLFCPGAFAAAQTMLGAVAASLGTHSPTRGFFAFYQTVADPDAAADDQAQTTVACLRTRAPWSRSRVIGAGVPLCHLIAYVSSPGPVGRIRGAHANPIPAQLRPFPLYLAQLYPPRATSLLSDFQVGAAFDPIVRELGAAARDGFLADYPTFAADALYDPAHWQLDPQYHGISGGGGGGWGGEIDIETAAADPMVMLAFGGGGGGGMTSMNSFGVTASRVGAGGGGGMQFADGYRVGGASYDGLGLGAGMGSDETAAQYSYFDYDGSPRPAQPIHDYNPALIADYQAQLGSLTQQLGSALASGATVVLRGGGGMGAGTEYLMDNGEEFTPHALSTQAGFQFRYEFAAADAAPPGSDGRDAALADAYGQLGDFYRTATAKAYQHCGRDYSNVTCMCPRAHAIVVCLMGRALGDPTKVPVWLQEQHCPDAAGMVAPASGVAQPSCADILVPTSSA